jgi:hypothetical protein
VVVRLDISVSQTSLSKGRLVMFNKSRKEQKVQRRIERKNAQKDREFAKAKRANDRMRNPYSTSRYF